MQTACFNLLERGEQAGDVGLGLRLAPDIARVSVDLVETDRSPGLFNAEIG